MGKKSIDPYVRAQVVALHDAGLNQKYKQLGRFDDLKHTERPKKLSGREIRHLKRLVKGDSHLSASKIASDLNTSLPKPIKTRTVRRYLKHLGFEYVVKIKKQWLSARRRQKCIAWYKQYLNWTKYDWGKVIFSDESTIYVLKRKNQCKIWRMDKKKLLPECLQQTNTGDGGNVGIWGGISGFGTTIAKICTENMNGQLYCNILQLQTELKRFVAKFPKKTKMIY
ncbi:unnamed protein product [Rotaria magnacalcarata]|uniref:Transposase Tc1-like domain-containing protein n=1 Tax=Rotaria magnacalcarata TaxID=392030 RepID=A0A816XYB1_9BILA|nr:unnamed protein product [Rotaria magnacalcarata]